MHDSGVAYNGITFLKIVILDLKYADVPMGINICILFMRIVHRTYNNSIENVCNHARIYED
jgi:hypothetical protein